MAAAEISDCTNKGAVSGVGSTSIGGIVGDWQCCGFVKDSTNEGTVTGTSGSGIGGIIGYLRYNNIQNGTECYKKVEVVEISGNTNKAVIQGGTATGVGGIVGLLYDAAIVTGNTNNATSISGGEMVAGIIGGYQNIITTSPYYDKKGYTETVISGNKSDTALNSITGSCKSEIIYNNATNPIKIKIINNEPTTNDVICSVTNDENEITYYTTVAGAESKFEDGDSLTLLNCSFSNDVSDDKASIWTVIHENCSKVENSWHVKNTKDFSGGYGTKIEPYIIATKEQFQNITKMYEKYAYYQIADNVKEIDCSAWTPVKLFGSFDGNGVTLKNIDQKLFSQVGYLPATSDLANWDERDIKLRNFTATFKLEGDLDAGVAAVGQINGDNTTTFENVTIAGRLSGGSNSAAFFNYTGPNAFDATVDGMEQIISFKECSVTAALTCSSGSIGILAGHPGYSNPNVTINCDKKLDSIFAGSALITNGAKVRIVGIDSTNKNYSGVDSEAWGTELGENSNKISRLTIKTPKKESTEYTVTWTGDAVRMEVYIAAQLTATDESGNDTAARGITLTLAHVLENQQKVESETNKNILSTFTTCELKSKQNEYSASVSGSSLTCTTGGNENYSYGTIKLQVAQYDSNNKMVAFGNLTIAEKAKGSEAWTVK